jgi:glycosyltransferase involved in cell wall biosynthesis
LPVVFSPRIGRIIKKINLDIIHAQHFLVCGQIAWYYSKKFNIPLIFTHHTRYDLFTDYVPLIPKEISKPLAQLLCAFYSDTCDGVIAPSQDVKNLLLKYKVKAPISVIPTGVDTEFFSKNGSQFLRKKYNLSKNAFLLLTISRLDSGKNVSFLIESFRRISKKYANAYFIIVGGGPSKKDLELQSIKLGLEEKIIFTGEILHKKMPDYYSSADIFVFSSLIETQGLVIVEAMASGLPVVAVKANGAKDIITHKQNGFLCSQNIDEFSKTVSKLIRNPDLRKKVSENAIKTVKDYSVEKSAKKLVDCYKKTQKKKKKKYEKFNFLQICQNI